MHLTLETDYAIRIVDCLARNGGRMGAKAIAEKTDVTLRFSLKILRKLVSTGIIRSYKGALGGYEIARPLSEISINDILETIEGPFVLNRCLNDEFDCTFTGDKRCPYHNMFYEISEQVRDQLQQATFAQILEGSLPEPSPIAPK